MRLCSNRSRTVVGSLTGCLALGMLGATVAVLHGTALPTGLLSSSGGRLQAAERRRKDESTLVKVGEAAPAFSVTTDDGTVVKLEELRGKVVLVVFFATYCPACRKELPYIEDLWSKYQDRENFSLLVIGREATETAVAEYKAEHEYTFPVAADPDRKIYEQYAAKSIPRAIVIGKTGKVIYQSAGYSKKRIITLGKVLGRRIR